MCENNLGGQHYMMMNPKIMENNGFILQMVQDREKRVDTHALTLSTMLTHLYDTLSATKLYFTLSSFKQYSPLQTRRLHLVLYRCWSRINERELGPPGGNKEKLPITEPTRVISAYSTIINCE